MLRAAGLQRVDAQPAAMLPRDAPVPAATHSELYFCSGEHTFGEKHPILRFEVELFNIFLTTDQLVRIF